MVPCIGASVGSGNRMVAGYFVSTFAQTWGLSVAANQIDAVSSGVAVTVVDVTVAVVPSPCAPTDLDFDFDDALARALKDFAATLDAGVL